MTGLLAGCKPQPGPAPTSVQDGRCWLADAVARAKAVEAIGYHDSPASGANGTTALDAFDYPIADAYRSIGTSLIRDLSQIGMRPGYLSLAGGYPGAELFDRDGLLAVSEAVMKEAPVACLQYGPTEGLAVAREAVCEVLVERGMRCTADQILMTSGSQQGFDLVIRTLVRPGDLAVVERPTYTGPLRSLRVAGAGILTVGIDDEGIDVDELAALLRARRASGEKMPTLLYTIPTFGNPSGATMSLARRLKLLEVAVEYGLIVLEDDPYGALRFHGEPIAALHALAARVPGAERLVIHFGSFSKIIAPGLRLGFMVSPAPVRAACLVARQLTDLSSPGWTQVAIARYVTSGRLAAHLPVIREGYRLKAEAMREALAARLGERLVCHFPEGGMFAWGRLADGRNARELLALAIDERVTFVPGDIYFADRADPASLRLSFSQPTVEGIREGVARIGRALDRLDAGERLPADASGAKS